MEFAPLTVQCIPDCFSLCPMTVRHPASSTPEPTKSLCLRCIFPESLPPEIFPIVGATCGIIGSVEAMEAIKLLTGLGEPLAGRLLFWDGLAGNADFLTVERDPSCPDCGKFQNRTTP